MTRLPNRKLTKLYAKKERLEKDIKFFLRRGENIAETLSKKDISPDKQLRFIGYRQETQEELDRAVCELADLIREIDLMREDDL